MMFHRLPDLNPQTPRKQFSLKLYHQIQKTYPLDKYFDPWYLFVQPSSE